MKRIVLALALLALSVVAGSALAQVSAFDLQIQQRNAANTGWAWKHLPCGALTGDGGLVFLSATKVPTCVKLGPNITISSGVMNVPVTTGPQGPVGPQGAASTVPGPQGPVGPASTVPGPAGPASTVPGPQGEAASIAVGTVAALPAGSTPTVTNTGTASAATFNFGIPAGAKGDTGNVGGAGPAGSAATVAVGTVTGLASGASPTIVNAGTSSAAVLNFGIPVGAVGPAGPSAYGAPSARTVALATAYQCTNTAKPCIITITLQSQSAFRVQISYPSPGNPRFTSSAVGSGTSGNATGSALSGVAGAAGAAARIRLQPA